MGAFVVRVEADDKDKGTNGEVRFAFEENPTNAQKDWLKFIIEPSTGVITTAVSIDREQQETYYVSITYTVDMPV